MDINKEISFGKGERGKRIHLIVDVDFFHGLLCKKESSEHIKDSSKTIHDVNCVRCRKTLTYLNLLRASNHGTTNKEIS